MTRITNSFVGPVRVYDYRELEDALNDTKNVRKRSLRSSLLIWLTVLVLTCSLAGNAFLISEYQKVVKENEELLGVIEFVAESLLDSGPAFGIPKLKKMPLET